MCIYRLKFDAFFDIDNFVDNWKILIFDIDNLPIIWKMPIYRLSINFFDIIAHPYWCMTELTGKWGWSSWGWQQPTPPSFHQRSVSSCHHTNSHNSSSSWATYTNPRFFMWMCEWWLTGVRVVQYAIWDRRRTCREKAQALLVASFHPELSSLFSSCSVHHNTTHLDILHSLNDQTWW